MLPRAQDPRTRRRWRRAVPPSSRPTGTDGSTSGSGCATGTIPTSSRTFGPRTPSRRRPRPTSRPCARSFFGEIKARIVETDLSVPVRKGPWWYYERTVEGRDYVIHCRTPVDAAAADPGTPPAVTDHAVPGEQVPLTRMCSPRATATSTSPTWPVSGPHAPGLCLGHHRGRALHLARARPRER